ncbi:hypothetical protein JCM30566_11560 [Marinitoga arctica]
MKYLNLEAIYLENDIIKIIVIPILGAKIASIYYKPQNFKVLFQPTKKNMIFRNMEIFLKNMILQV